MVEGASHPSDIASRNERAGTHRLARRAAILAGLLCLQILSLLAPYDLAGRDSGARAAEDFVQSVIAGTPLAICFVAVFVMAAWPRWRQLLGDWISAVEAHPWRAWALASAIAAALLFAVTLAVKLSDASRLQSIWLLVALWGVGVALVVGLLALAAAPAGFWRMLIVRYRAEVAFGAAGTALVWAFASLAQQSWTRLAGATFEVSRRILGAYEPDTFVDVPKRILGVGDFSVVIAPDCSGYEGIGLVTAFLLIYIAVFRRQLKFPNILLLFPIAACLIWLLNALRIAMLVSIGAHVSPALALHGFHSAAGWLMFLGVTLAILFATHRIAFFRADGFRSARVEDPAVRLAIALLCPFIALMAGRVVSSIFASAGHWFYVAEVVFVGVALFLFRDVYARLLERVSWQAVGVGVLIGVAWVATDPARGTSGPIDAWIASLPPVGAALWLAVRIVGLVILVPVAEELAFRGYLLRALSAKHFENAGSRQFTWVAFLVSTGLFAALHSRWLAAGLAGALYAYLYFRSGRLADPIASHAASNAVIAATALLTRQWSLL